MLTSLQDSDVRSDNLISLRRQIYNEQRKIATEIGKRREELSKERGIPLSYLPARGVSAHTLPEFAAFFEEAYNAAYGGVFSSYTSDLEILLSALHGKVVYLTYKLGNEVEYAKGRVNRDITNVFMTAKLVGISQETGVQPAKSIKKKLMHEKTTEEKAERYFRFVWDRLQRGIPEGMDASYSGRHWIKEPYSDTSRHSLGRMEASQAYEYVRKTARYAKLLANTNILEPELMTNFGPKSAATVASANAIKGATLLIKVVPKSKDSSVYLLSAMSYTSRRKINGYGQPKILILEKTLKCKPWYEIARWYRHRVREVSKISVIPFFWYPPRERYLIEGII